jgi:ubiquinone/menaquinone biosynthesis C-methylase UbiE
MDIFTGLDPSSDYSKTSLQFIVGAWVMATPFEPKQKVSTNNGDVAEEDYDKRSIYSLLYALYRSVGTVKTEHGEPYEFTFNTWGYTWPAAWGPRPTGERDPERYGKNAYTGLYHFQQIKDFVASKDGKVHVVEMGCGTAAGANEVCTNVLPKCTYHAFDMQQAAVNTAHRKFVGNHGGRLTVTRADCTALPIADAVADIVAVNETHVTEMVGHASEEDIKFFAQMYRVLKPGGFMVWGNAIPESTWKPCFDAMVALGMEVVEVCDVTKEAILARDEDKARADIYVEQCLNTYWGFRIPVYGGRKREAAEMAMKNFYRNPGTNLYDTMVNGTDTYKVVLLRKPAT